MYKPRVVDDATLPEDDQVESTRGAVTPEVSALVVVFSGDEPERLGESLLIPDGSGPFLFGRGPAGVEDQHRRLFLVRHRPGRGQTEITPPLSCRHISRAQLLLRADPSGQLSVENVGLCRLYHDGTECQKSVVHPGETLQLGQRILLLCVRRPLMGEGRFAEINQHEFGKPDGELIVGESPRIWRLRQLIRFVAGREGHVLVQGPSGSGKELVARGIHALSQRGNQPLLSRNASTIPEPLAAAELFGNTKNYPNPGMPERAGLIGQASGSSLLLDEFGELPLAMQPQLLRVLDAGEYQRLGEAHVRHANFRLIAVTNRPESVLKHDLAARFAFRIEVPDLNARREDIPLLIRHLLSESPLEPPPSGLGTTAPPRAAEIPLGLVRELCLRNYETNVRELSRLIVERVRMPRTSRGASRGGSEKREPVPSAPDEQESNADESNRLEPRSIQACLDRNNGVIELAWRELGLSSRHALSRLIAKHGLVVRRRHGPLGGNDSGAH
jgi:DNA-binding NtrC family response regulator